VGLLLVYWALNIPAAGKQLAEAALIYPRLRNLAARLIEPLDAPTAEVATSEMAPVQADRAPGVSIQFEGVSVKALGQAILEPFDLQIEPGTHVCIVGASGAGKSSLAGLLLGWHTPASGQIKIDGEPLNSATLGALRSEIAWVDPNIQLWNRSLVENLRYGVPIENGLPTVGQVVGDADLFSLIERLPDGLQSSLGEGGALVSGGEGQRVRLGRAMLRPQPRLVILDEPFSALDREKREEFLRRIRRKWSTATLLCITHDIRESLRFDRVMVMDHGRIIEYGDPAELAQNPGSGFSQLLAADDAVQQLWQAPIWRKVRVEHGQIVESGEQAESNVLARRPPGRGVRSTRAGVGAAAQAESEDSVSRMAS
jgi:ATP-binding cassette subfamily B protein